MSRIVDLIFGGSLVLLVVLMAAGYAAMAFAPQILERILQADIFVSAVFITAAALAIVLERFKK
jgi:hypothetical protein